MIDDEPSGHVEQEVGDDSLSARMARLLQRGTHADTTLTCEERRFPVRRAVLSASSKVFEAMFSEEKYRGGGGETDVVDIKGFGPEVLEAMLECAYTDEVDGIEACAEDLLAAADMYIRRGRARGPVRVRPDGAPVAGQRN